MNLLWRGAADALTPFVLAWLGARAASGKEHPQRWPERLGRASLPRPEGKLIWLHAASVGECLSVLPLIDALRARHPALSVLMTTGTRTSAEVFAARAPGGGLDGAVHQFAPVDLPWAARRFIKHWRPDAAVLVESELWPSLISAAAQSGARMALVSGRISERATARWMRWPGLTKRMSGAFRLCLAQTGADAERFRKLGFPAPEVTGGLKDSAPPPPVNEAERARLAALIGPRPVWLALSIHPGEDAAVAQAHKIVRTRLPGALCIAAPRHPPKAAAMAETFQAAGLFTARRSLGEDPGGETDVYIADTMGETGTMAALAGAAFIGKSLPVALTGGGQNPLEPAKMGLPVLFGPDMGNFQASATAMLAAGAARRVGNATMLGEAAAELLADAGDMRAAVRAFTESLPDVLGRTLAALAPLLDEPNENA